MEVGNIHLIVCKKLFILLFIMPVLVFAQSANKEMELIETGQFKKSKFYELADVTRVISENEIKLRGANNLKDILILETSSIFNYDKTKGWSVLWHGSSKNNILILIDGLPFRSYYFDENDLQQISLDNVNKIEFVENPLCVEYGSNAITCIINIIYKTAQEKVYKPSLKLQGYYPASFYSNISLGRKTTENFFKYSGTIDAFSGIGGNDSGRVLQWLPYTRAINQINFSHKILQYLDFSIGYNNLIEQKTQLGYPLLNSTKVFDREIKYNINNFNVGLKGKLTKNYNIQGDFQYMHYRRFNTLYYKDISNSQQIAVNDTSLNDSIKYSGIFSRWVFSQNDKNSKLNYIVGFDIYTTSDRFKPIVNKVYQKNSTSAIFFVVKYTPNSRTIIYGGIRLPYSSKYKSKPMLDLKINLKINENFRLKAMIAQSSKSPDFDQIFATYLTNGFSIKRNLNLSNENVSSFNYSILIKTKKIIAEPGFFFYHFKNGIELIPDPVNIGRLVYRNVSEKKILGTRINFIAQSKYADINLRMAYTGNNHLAHKYDQMFFFREFYTNVIFKIPKYSSNLCITSKNVSVFSFMKNETNNDFAHFIDGYFLADAICETSFNKKTIILKAGVRNIFNLKNIEAYLLPADFTGKEDKTFYNVSLLSGRNVFFEININL